MPSAGANQRRGVNVKCAASLNNNVGGAASAPVNTGLKMMPVLTRLPVPPPQPAASDNGPLTAPHQLAEANTGRVGLRLRRPYCVWLMMRLP